MTQCEANSRREAAGSPSVSQQFISNPGGVPMTSWRSALDAVRVLVLVLISLVSVGARSQPADASLPAVQMDDPSTWLPDPDPFAPTTPVDPRVRGGPSGPGGPLPAPHPPHLALFTPRPD